MLKRLTYLLLIALLIIGSASMTACKDLAKSHDVAPTLDLTGTSWKVSSMMMLIGSGNVLKDLDTGNDITFVFEANGQFVGHCPEIDIKGTWSVSGNKTILINLEKQPEGRYDQGETDETLVIESSFGSAVLNATKFLTSDEDTFLRLFDENGREILQAERL